MLGRRMIVIGTVLLLVMALSPVLPAHAENASCSITARAPRLVGGLVVSSGSGDCGDTLTRVKVCADYASLRGIDCAESWGPGPQSATAAAPCLPGYWSTYVYAADMFTGDSTEGHSNLVWISCPMQT